MNLEIINQHFDEHLKVIKSIDNGQKEEILLIANVMVKSLAAGGTIFWCGNGGSASDSQHLAGELVGRFVGDRKPLRSLSLNADSAVMTCIINDFGYESLFSRQVEGLGSSGDVLVGITTSGNSQNVLKALEAANKMSMTTIGFLGKGGGAAKNLAQHSIIIESNSTARIQEAHITLGHILCDLIEEGLNLKP